MSGSSMYWIDGLQSETISVKDRSFQYGDGAFTTMLTIDDEIHLWEFHKQRMEACLQTLSIPYPDWKIVEQWLREATLAAPKAGLKLLISRGQGGRGYGLKGANQPLVVISQFAYPEHYTQWQEQGITLGTCSTKLGLNPILAGHKHNNRLEQVLIKNEIDQMGWQDALVLDLNNHPIETSSANLFWIKSNTLYTSSLKTSGVAGVIRRHVLGIAKHEKLRISIGDFSVQDLHNAESVFMTNSLMGVVPVCALLDETNDKQTKFSIGSITRNFQEKIYRA